MKMTEKQTILIVELAWVIYTIGEKNVFRIFEHPQLGDLLIEFNTFFFRNMKNIINFQTIK